MRCPIGMDCPETDRQRVIDGGMDNVSPTADLNACDREAIQFSGCIQPHGFLLELSADWVVIRASGNLADYLPIAAGAALGQAAETVLGAQATHDIRGQLQILVGGESVQRLFGVAIGPGAPAIDIAVHRSGNSLIIEGETSNPADAGMATAVQPMLMQLRGLRPLNRFCAQLARQVRVLSGYDRVMVYQFLPDGSGKVVAETRRAGLIAFKGLRYPATDIPKQARTLYERNTIRMIADVDAQVVPVMPQIDRAGAMLELSMSTLRAVSPVHLEYLRNMGVAASMSISILTGGKLWGLVACHHQTPRALSLRCRTTLEFMGQMVTAMVDAEVRAVEKQHQAAARALHTDIVAALSSEGATVDHVFPQLREMQTLLAADGLATYIEGHVRVSGATPTEAQVTSMIPFLEQVVPSRIYTTHALSAAYPVASEFADVASGLLVIPISRKPRDFVIFFRGELVQQVTWAGDPVKQIADIETGARFSPRNSFAAWQETVHQQSAYWSEPELAAAEALRGTLLETLLEVTDRSEKRRKLFNDQQDLLIAELNHRVRNILSLIVGLVGQCSVGAASVGELAVEISQRVRALARAHDQLTSGGWGARSIYTMIRIEASAYLGERADRVRITGPDLHVRPDAFTTLALVVHELITNSAKYGAFRGVSGSVNIQLKRDASNALVIAWAEHGGGPVVQPTRRGFGSTIIERAIPHELDGTASVDYAPDGFRAEFTIPQAYVFDAGLTETPLIEAIEPMVQEIARLSGKVLLVEDNLLIALETDDALRSLGADEVQIASTASAALAYLVTNRPDFGLLDYNLGREQSAPVADPAGGARHPVLVCDRLRRHLDDRCPFSGPSHVVQAVCCARHSHGIQRGVALWRHD